MGALDAQAQLATTELGFLEVLRQGDLETVDPSTQIADLQASLNLRLDAATGEGINAGMKFGERKGLSEVIIAPGAQPPAAEGSKIRVTFKDGRQVAGFSHDFEEKTAGFFVVPADNRTNTARIFVFRHAVQKIVEG